MSGLGLVPRVEANFLGLGFLRALKGSSFLTGTCEGFSFKGCLVLPSGCLKFEVWLKVFQDPVFF